MKTIMRPLLISIFLLVWPLCATTGSARAAIPGEYVITDYGARGDAIFDNAPIINRLLNKLPPIGGTILIPSGEFLINSPLVVTSCNVTIQGLNRGWRSNVDLPVPGISRLGGGSKIIVGPVSSCGIRVPVRPRLNTGQANRLTGLTIRDLNVTGAGTGAGQDGIDVEQDGDGLVIDDVSCIDLDKGIVLNAADASRITGCLVAECRTCISVSNSIQTMVANCDLGGQPRGVTCQFTGDNQFTVSGCDIFPDGASAVTLNQCQYGAISACLISGWYTGLVEIEGRHNSMIGDSISAIDRGGGWPADPSGRSSDWGLIRLSGDDNSVLSCCIDSEQPANDTRVHCVSGARTTVSDLSFSGNPSSRKVVIEASSVDAKVLNCATASEIQAPAGVPETIVAIPPAGS